MSAVSASTSPTRAGADPRAGAARPAASVSAKVRPAATSPALPVSAVPPGPAWVILPGLPGASGAPLSASGVAPGAPVPGPVTFIAKARSPYHSRARVTPGSGPDVGDRGLRRVLLGAHDVRDRREALAVLLH